MAETLLLVAKILSMVTGVAVTIGAASSLSLSNRDLTRDAENGSSVFLRELLISIFACFLITIIPRSVMGGIAVLVVLAIVSYFRWSKRDKDIALFQENWRSMRATKWAFLSGLALLAFGTGLIVFL